MRLLLSIVCPLLLTFPALADDDDVSTGAVTRTVDVARAKDATKADRVIAEVVNGSIELVVDAGRDTPQVEAEFTVDGSDEKDVKRRTELVKLYAERAADQTVVVQPMFPGKAMKRDSVKVRIIIPSCGEASLKSANGTLATRGTAGKLKLHAKNGAISVDGHVGALDATSTSGSIEIKGAGGEVRATSTSGSIEVRLADGNNRPFEIESRTGTVRVEVGASFNGTVKLNTTSGGLDLADGARRARMTLASDHAKTFEIGEPGDQSEIRTTTGSIKLSVRAK